MDIQKIYLHKKPINIINMLSPTVPTTLWCSHKHQTLFLANFHTLFPLYPTSELPNASLPSSIYAQKFQYSASLPTDLLHFLSSLTSISFFQFTPEFLPALFCSKDHGVQFYLLTFKILQYQQFTDVCHLKLSSWLFPTFHSHAQGLFKNFLTVFTCKMIVIFWQIKAQCKCNSHDWFQY